MSFANSELMANIGGVILPLVGRYQPVRMDKEDCLRRFHMDCARLESHLQQNNRRYLVGDELTIADLFTVGCMLFGVKVFYKLMLDKYPRTTSWFLEIHHLPIMKDVLGEFEPLHIPVPELKES
jgi:elongation factor 1-gamma